MGLASAQAHSAADLGAPLPAVPSAPARKLAFVPVTDIRTVNETPFGWALDMAMEGCKGIASHRIASHRIASHRIASHRIASHHSTA
jgi:hypothetical protein